MKYQRVSIGRDRAIELAESGWWEGKTAREIATFQMFVDELAMPFSTFHKALEEALGRPVWTHEMGINWEGLADELCGGGCAPDMEDIIGLMPKHQYIIVVADKSKEEATQ